MTLPTHDALPDDQPGSATTDALPAPHEPSTDVGRAGELDLVLLRLAESFRRLIEVLPGSETPAALAREFGVPRKLAWQFHKVAACTSATDVPAFAPGPKPARGLLSRIADRGIDASRVADAAAAFDAYDNAVREHAGDRNTLLAMIGGGGAKRQTVAAGDVDRQHRAGIFRSFTHFYGMSAEVACDVHFMSLDDDGLCTDVDLRSVRGLRRLRADAHRVYERHTLRTESENADERVLQPLDLQAFREHGAPVIPSLSSRPLPGLLISHDQLPDGKMYRVEWGGDIVGPTRTADLTTGIVTRYRFPRFGDAKEHGIRRTSMIGYPVKRYVQTWLIRLAGRRLVEPRLMLQISPLAASSDEERRVLPTYPMSERLEVFAPGAWRTHPNRFADVREQVVYACARMNWDPQDFHIYELQVEYPLMHSVITVHVPWIEV